MKRYCEYCKRLLKEKFLTHDKEYYWFCKNKTDCRKEQTKIGVKR